MLSLGIVAHSTCSLASKRHCRGCLGKRGEHDNWAELCKQTQKPRGGNFRLECNGLKDAMWLSWLYQKSCAPPVHEVKTGP